MKKILIFPVLLYTLMLLMSCSSTPVSEKIFDWSLKNQCAFSIQVYIDNSFKGVLQSQNQWNLSLIGPKHTLKWESDFGGSFSREIDASNSPGSIICP